MQQDRILKLVLPIQIDLKKLSNKTLQSSWKHSPVKSPIKEATEISEKTENAFQKYFKKTYYTNVFGFEYDEKKSKLLKDLCSRKSLRIKDIGSISRYDTATVEFLSSLPDDKLSKLQAFLDMKDPLIPQFQLVESDTLKALSEMDDAKIDFVKKYIQTQNRDCLVFFNQKHLIEIAKTGYDEQAMGKLIFKGGLSGEDILEATKIRNLDADRLIDEINKAKKEYGKGFTRVHIFHNDYDEQSFTLEITNSLEKKGILKTFDRNFNVTSTEDLFIESIGNGSKTITNDETLDAQETLKTFDELQKDENNVVVTLRRVSQKEDLHANMSATAILKDVEDKGINSALLHNTQFLNEEISYLNKNGEKIVETIIPTEVKGAYRITQTLPDGTVKILGDAKIDPETGIKTITRNFESINGTTTDKILTINPNGSSSMSYIIKDANGNTLMNRQLSHTFISDNEAISKINEKTYHILYSTNEITVSDVQNGKTTTISLDELLKDASNKKREEMVETLKKLPAEQLLHLNDKVKSFKVIDDVLASSACYGGEDMGIIETRGNQGALTHELHHLISQSQNIRNIKNAENAPKNIAQNDKLLDAYIKELDLYLKRFPEARLQNTDYLTSQAAPASSIEEAISDGGVLLNTYNNIERLSIRTELLERYFPETIAEIEKLTRYTD